MRKAVEIHNIRSLELAKNIMELLAASNPIPTSSQVEDALKIASILQNSTTFPPWPSPAAQTAHDGK